jgi:hypothetical protein
MESLCTNLVSISYILRIGKEALVSKSSTDIGIICMYLCMFIFYYKYFVIVQSVFCCTDSCILCLYVLYMFTFY